jgi:hypothetical protein
MAIVPTTGGATVQPNAGGPVYQSASGATPEAFGAGAARQTIQAADQLGRAADRMGAVAIDMQQEENKRQVKDADTEFRQGLLSLQYGDGTEENPGYFGLKGQTAVDKFSEYQDRMTKLREQAGSRLSNDTQKRDFETVAGQHTQATSERMLRYNTEQRRSSQLATSEARQGIAVSEAAANYNDPQALAGALATVRGEALSQAQISGAGPEVTMALIRKAETQVLSATILTAVEKDPALAERLLRENAGRMDPAAALSVRKVVDKQFYEIKSQEVADFYGAEVRSGRMTPDQALEAIRKEYSGDMETAAVKELTGRIRDTMSFEANQRAREAAERARANEREADQRRAAADVRRAENDRIASEARTLAEGRRLLADLRREGKDEEAVRRQEAALARQESALAERRQRLLRTEADAARKSQTTEDVNAVAQTITDMGGNLEERVGKVRDTLTGELRTRAETLVVQMYARDQKIAQEARAERINGLSDAIRGGRKFDDLSAQERSGLTASEERNLREISRRTQLGIPNESEPGLIGEIFSMIEGKRVDEFLAMSPDDVRTRLSDDDYKRYYSLRLSAAQGRMDPNVSADAAFVFGRLRGYSQFQSASKKDDVNRLAEVILSEVNSLRAEKRGGRITDAERLEIVNQAVAAYITDKPGTVYGRNVSENAPAVADAQARGPRLATARAAATLGIAPDPKTLDAIRTVSIPTEERPQLIAAWRRSFGTAQTPSEAQLKALYWKANNSQ